MSKSKIEYNLTKVYLIKKIITTAVEMKNK
jgi:hypothetical protein